MHELTLAIANYVRSTAAEASAQPGSWERDAARTEARTDLDRLNALIEKLFSEGGRDRRAAEHARRWAE